VPLIEVPAAITLGEWCGLCKIDKEGKPRKVVSTSVAVITDFGEASNELEILMNHLKGSA
jgi:small subunit ribosomal protein S12e